MAASGSVELGRVVLAVLRRVGVEPVDGLADVVGEAVASVSDRIALDVHVAVVVMELLDIARDAGLGDGEKCGTPPA
jgi:hypothetical protein